MTRKLNLVRNKNVTLWMLFTLTGITFNRNQKKFLSIVHCFVYNVFFMH